MHTSPKWKRIIHTFILAMSLILAVSVSAQMKIPDEFTNLKVLPKDIAKDDLIAMMKGFTRDLDLRCNSCHVNNSEDRSWDFVSDSLEMKNTARVMIEMLQNINGSYISKVAAHNDNHAVKVECATCHRGHKEPETLDQALNDSYAHEGVQATIEKYRALREKYYGGAGYDFSENGLINFVLAYVPDSLPQDGIELLNLNVEFLENPGFTHYYLCEIFAKMDKKDEAISHIEKCIELRPDFKYAQRVLENLKK